MNLYGGKKIQLEQEKIKVYRAMVWSSQHVLNNLLNQMMMFKLTAESTPEFNPNIIKLFDEMVDDAEKQIKALSNITDLDENKIRDSVSAYEYLKDS